LLLRVLSAVHSNLPALEKVLSHADGSCADCTVCLGDVVGYGGDPSPCIRMVR
jgi:predicted phosphodiesterase